MIIGLGNDIVDTRRLKATWDRRSNRFVSRIYTPAEQEFCLSKFSPIDAFGRYYAAKEASVKALGTGFTGGVSWRSVEVIRRTNMKPTLAFHGAALQRLEDMTPNGYEPRWELSMSDEPPYASAVVVLFAVKVSEQVARSSTTRYSLKDTRE